MTLFNNLQLKLIFVSTAVDFSFTVRKQQHKYVEDVHWYSYNSKSIRSTLNFVNRQLFCRHIICRHFIKKYYCKHPTKLQSVA